MRRLLCYLLLPIARVFFFLASFLFHRTRLGRFTLLKECDCEFHRQEPCFATVMASVFEQLKQANPDEYEYLQQNCRYVFEGREEGAVQKALAKRGHATYPIYCIPRARLLFVQIDQVRHADLAFEDLTTLLASELYASIVWYRAKDERHTAHDALSDDEKFWQYLETQVDYLERSTSQSLDLRPILAFYGESYFERLQKLSSGVTKIDSLEIASCDPSVKLSKHFRSTIVESLRLLRKYDARRHQRVVDHLQRVYLCPLFSMGLFQKELQLCLVDFSQLVEHHGQDQRDLAIRLAGVLVHEATHGRLDRWGIAYEGAARERSELICFAEEGRTIQKLSGPEQASELPKFDLETYELTWDRTLTDMIRICYQTAQRKADKPDNGAPNASLSGALALPIVSNTSAISDA